MDDVKNISIREIVQSDMDAVIELLQSMSEFKPSKSEYLPIWNSFHQQSNVHSDIWRPLTYFIFLSDVFVLLFFWKSEEFFFAIVLREREEKERERDMRMNKLP